MSTSPGKALLNSKCPRCHKGEMFINPATKKWYSVAMHEECPVCQLRYEREPGFFYGAMYVSYGFSAAIMLSLGFVFKVFFEDLELWIYLTTVSLVVAILWPQMYRYSRTIYLHVFGGVRFDPQYED